MAAVDPVPVLLQHHGGGGGGPAAMSVDDATTAARGEQEGVVWVVDYSGRDMMADPTAYASLRRGQWRWGLRGLYHSDRACRRFFKPVPPTLKHLYDVANGCFQPCPDCRSPDKMTDAERAFWGFREQARP
jgi:hypothetical protein